LASSRTGPRTPAGELCCSRRSSLCQLARRTRRRSEAVAGASSGSARTGEMLGAVL
jgi:hypothetical protein